MPKYRGKSKREGSSKPTLFPMGKAGVQKEKKKRRGGRIRGKRILLRRFVTLVFGRTRNNQSLNLLAFKRSVAREEGGPLKGLEKRKRKQKGKAPGVKIKPKKMRDEGKLGGVRKGMTDEGKGEKQHNGRGRKTQSSQNKP